ncbi:MAG: hypothetical protein M1608_01115 [Candidatus Omnitrophica bacterium]|nr:hypothetical protein [Candidatus Omnitrophota bacterium]
MVWEKLCAIWLYVVISGCLVFSSAFLVNGQPAFLDIGFDPGNGPDGKIRGMALQADGKILVAGGFTNFAGIVRRQIARLNTNGTVDLTYSCHPEPNAPVKSILAYPGGKALVEGDFTEIGGLHRVYYARLNRDGSVDPSFDPGEDLPQLATVVQSDGKILLYGNFQSIRGLPVSGVARLNSDGTVDASFQPFLGFASSQASDLVVQPDGAIIITGAFRRSNAEPVQYMLHLTSEGAKDPSFHAPSDTYFGDGLALQPNGRILLYSPSMIERLFPDGSRDSSLDISYPYYAVAFSDYANRILLWKATEYDSFPTGDLVRLDFNGSRDWSFDIGLFRGIDIVTVQPDGKLLIAGDFTEVEGIPRRFVARLLEYSEKAVFHFATPAYETSETNSQVRLQVVRGGPPDNTVSVAFHTADDTATAGYDYVAQTGRIEFGPRERFQTIAISILRDPLGGEADEDFTIALENPGPGAVITSPATAKVSIHEDEHYDSTFDPGAIDRILSLSLQPDGKLLVSGLFTNIHGVPRSHIARLNSDGSLDPSWHAPTFWPYPSFLGCDYILSLDVVLVQPDGRIVVAGAFTGANRSDYAYPRGFARLNPDGSLDTAFDPGPMYGLYAAPNWPLFAGGAIQPDGKLILGGAFIMRVENEPTNLVRLPAGPPLVTEARFEQIAVETNGTVKGTVSFEGSQYYVIEASTDFRHWLPVYTNIDQQRLSSFADAGAMSRLRRFYRIRPWE